MVLFSVVQYKLKYDLNKNAQREIKPSQQKIVLISQLLGSIAANSMRTKAVTQELLFGDNRISWLSPIVKC
jgi:hypothetical protein